MSRLRNLVRAPAPGGLLMVMGGLLMVIACSSGASMDKNAKGGEPNGRGESATDIDRADPFAAPDATPAAMARPVQTPSEARPDAADPHQLANAAADSGASTVQAAGKPEPAPARRQQMTAGARPGQSAGKNATGKNTTKNAAGSTSTSDAAAVPDKTTGDRSGDASGAQAGLRITATQPVTTPAASQHLLAPAADKPKSKPRDLQVLPKTWSRERVDRYMEDEVERGLGVKCEHCHDTSDYAADHPHKKAARRMMRMTRDLNRDYFKGQSKMTCYSCHKGKRTP